MDNFVILQSANATLGVISPLLIALLKGLITTNKTPKWVVYLISILFNLVCAIITTLLAGYTFNDWVAVVTSVGVVISTTQTSYNLWMNNLGWTDAVTKGIKGE